MSGSRHWVLLSLCCEISFLFNLLARQLECSLLSGSRHWVLLSLACEISFLFNWLARQLALCLSGSRHWVLLSLACEISFLFGLLFFCDTGSLVWLVRLASSSTWLARQLALCCLAQDTGSFLVWLVRLASSSTGWRDSLLFFCCLSCPGSRHWVLLSLACEISFLFNWLARQLALCSLALKILGPS